VEAAVISDRLTNVIRKELSLGELTLTEETVAPEVPGWDSLSHVRILLAVEEEFGIRFRSLEVMRLKTVGDLQALVSRKTGG
jgi:acyl carrier protein